ncbi:monosaccharide ABC transporter substrate-binding protein (CUT2 family) [Kushneria sinocarnis]|uniref:Monosaccharide ABC transporter substrate-binding protein (CUT2 family) n=1 Tax=Kushneria sinocarnis TaxID=595502 RepID=A0A420X204_9GAMM|nr:substrate-binding domain-containing protein [Kushneria sinocarnis]RKR07695.1 monosaccharide ABC transporter substrate-binding protein (CUT2 family) [Kushneria sinocarnis]
MRRAKWFRQLAVGAAAMCGLSLMGVAQAQQSETQENKEPLTIGYTVYAMSGWVSSGREGVDAVARANNVDLRWASADNSVASQVAQMNQFIAQGVDAIVVDPVDSAALGPQIKKARERDIPVIGTNVKVFDPGKQYLNSYVGPDDIAAGENQTRALIRKIGGKGNVVILQGPLGQSGTIDRTKGIENVLAEHPEVKVLAKRPGDWKREEGYNIMASWLSRYGEDIDGVISENDDMAVGAIRAMRQRRINDIPIVGIDGIEAGLQNVAAGHQLMSNLQNAPLQLGMALQVAVNAARGQEVPKEIFIGMPIVTQENAEQYYRQMYKNREQFLDELPELIRRNLASGDYGNQQ